MENIQDVEDAIKFAKAWARMGSSVQEQVEDVLLERDDDLNPNAIAAGVRALADYPEFADPLQAWLDDEEAREHVRLWQLEADG